MSSTSANDPEIRVQTPRYALRIPTKPDIDAMRRLVARGTDIDLELQSSVLADDGTIDLVCWNWMAITKPGRTGQILGVQYFRNPEGETPFQMLTAFPAARPNERARVHVTEAALRFAFSALEVPVVRTRMHADRHREIEALVNRGFKETSRSEIAVDTEPQQFVSLELSEARFQEFEPVVRVEMLNPHVAAATFGLGGSSPRGLS